MRQAGSFDARWVLTALVLAMAPGAAMAYIDPGSGAYMVQALFALVAAGLFYARHPIRSLKAFWRWVRKRPEADPSLPQTDAGEAADEKISSGDS